VVPNFARPGRLRRLLDSLEVQTLAPDRFEVVVIDDGSPPDRAPPDAWFDGEWLRLERRANAGPAAARNRGAALARGAMLAFVDDDCVADPGWLEALWQAHEARPEALLGGRTENGLTENLYSATSESLLAFFDEEARRRGHAPALLASNNLALARAAFERIGGFDASYPLAAGEDRDLCRRWARDGGPLQRAPEALVRHLHPLDLNGFWRQHTHYGRGAARFRTDRRERDVIEPTDARDFHVRLLAHPLTSRPGWPLRRRLAVTALTLMSQIAIANGMLRERLTVRPEDRPEDRPR